MNLQQLKAGVSQSQSVNNPVPNQTVQVVAYDPVAACQGTGPISPSKQTTDLTPKALITDACGTIYLDIDNSATGATNQKVTLGGPFGTDGGANSKYFTGTVLGGFQAAGLLVNIVNGPVPAAGSTYFGGALAFGFAAVNEFAKMQQSIIITNVGFRNFDISSAPIADFVNGSMTPFTIDFSSNLEYTTTNAQFFSTLTNTGGGNNVTGYFNFGNGIPASQTTGVQIEIPAGFAEKISVCIGAVQSNISYSEGC